MKAFFLAFNSLFDNNNDSHKANGDDNESTHNGKDEDREMDEDVHIFLAKVGSLKK
jgi:hypothetical protein